MDNNKTMPYNGFGLVAHILKLALSSVFKSAVQVDDEPEKALILRAIYEKALKTLKGITSVQISLDAVVGHLVSDNFDAFALLPSAAAVFNDAPEDVKPENDINLNTADALPIEQTVFFCLFFFNFFLVYIHVQW